MALLDRQIKQIQQAGIRYAQDATNREKTQKELDKGIHGDPFKIDAPDRIASNCRIRGFRETEINKVYTNKTFALERIIGANNELMDITFLYKGAAISRSVGRVVIQSAEGNGFGTGFMVSPRLLMTNNHVLKNRQTASNSFIQFGYYELTPGNTQPPVQFRFEPGTFFMTDEALDFTLVAVQPVNANGDAVEERGWNQLHPASGKALVGHRVNIIQHPSGEPLQLSIRQNKVVRLPESFLHYETDTQRGSSGSPVYNDHWQVAALHHAGVPDMDANGNYLLTDGSIWNRSTQDISNINWVANEGIRISQIVSHVESQLSTAPQSQKDIFAQTQLPPPSFLDLISAQSNSWTADDTEQVLAPRMVMGDDGVAHWTIPLQISVGVGQGQMPAISHPTRGESPASASPTGGLVSVSNADIERFKESIKPFGPDNPYYDAEADKAAIKAYYPESLDNIEGSSRKKSKAMFDMLSDLLINTHQTQLTNYKRTRWDHLYPLVDRKEAGHLHSIYAKPNDQIFDPLETILNEVELEMELEARTKELMQMELSREDLQSELDLLESSTPFNCEHVVPQSWFNKHKVPKCDLHHLFTCESGCNSFRSNLAYFDFEGFDPEDSSVSMDEAERDACGFRDGENRFEPNAGKGTVARATLYFLLRYRGEIGGDGVRLSSESIKTLIQWHNSFPPNEYEKHRNATIFTVQGNRNPLIDFPEWIEKIDFTQGFVKP